MRQQKPHPLSPAEQKRFRLAIRAAVVATFGARPRTSPHRGYIDRAACGRTIPGLDVLTIALLAKRCGCSHEECRRLPKLLLDLVDAEFTPAEGPACPVEAIVADVSHDAPADVAAVEALTLQTPEALERAAELRERQVTAGLHVVRVLRHTANQARQRRNPGWAA